MCKTHKNLIINDRIRDIDSCIFDFVKLLNENGYITVASCCGHGNRPVSIILDGDKEIMIMKFEEARKFDKLFPPIHPNEE